MIIDDEKGPLLSLGSAWVCGVKLLRFWIVRVRPTVASSWSRSELDSLGIGWGGRVGGNLRAITF